MLRFIFINVFCSCFFSLSAQNTDSTNDCFDRFFKATTLVKNPSKISLVMKNGKQMLLSSFTKDMGENKKIGLRDLDGDGKKELVIYNYTGGAHCCDEFYFFKNTAANKYQLTNKLYAGNTCVTNNNEWVYDFYEMFGYFFTCFACSYSENDSSSGIQHTSAILLKYKNGKLIIEKGNQALKKTINKNLSILSNLQWDGGLKTDIDQDDGRRKEVALNLAVYYFSFGRNVTELKTLFDKYYKFKDAKKVWTEFLRSLNAAKADIGF